MSSNRIIEDPFYKMKFIVFSIKDLKNVDEQTLSAIKKLSGYVALNRGKRGAELYPQYLTINQDEPYAEEVFAVIKRGEQSKSKSELMSNLVETLKMVYDKYAVKEGFWSHDRQQILEAIAKAEGIK